MAERMTDREPAARVTEPLPARPHSLSPVEAEALLSPVEAEVLHLQRAAGNRAVQRLLESEQEKVDRAARTLDVADIKAIGDYTLVKPADRMKMIHALAFQGWVGPWDEWALEALWGLYGDQVLEVASANAADWKQSIDRGAELGKLPAVMALSDKFLGDVQGVALGYLDENERYAKQEMAALGQPGPDLAQRTADLQEGARIIEKAKEGQRVLSDVVVGYRMEYIYGVDGAYAQYEVPATFQPFAPPPLDRTAVPTPSDVAMPSHAEVQAQYETLMMIIEMVKAKHPSLFAVAEHGAEGDMAKVAEGKPADAQAIVLGGMGKLLANIAATKGRVKGNLLYELKPIHAQLLSGGVRGRSDIDWQSPVYKAVVDDSLAGHESAEFWTTLGLSSLAAAAFVVASIATGGLAAIAFGVGLGIGVGQAAASWDKAYEISKAAGSSLSRKTQMVDPSQATMATLAAVLDTVFAAVDVFGIGKVLRGAGLSVAALKAGTRKAAIAGLEQVATKEAAEAAPLVERGVLELGVRATEARTGLSAEKLRQILNSGGKGASDAAERLAAYTKLRTSHADLVELSQDALEKRILNLGDEMAANREAGEALARVGLEHLGPLGLLRKAGGWQKLSLALGNNSATGKAVMAWRDSAFADIEAFVKTLPGGVTDEGRPAVMRTGSKGNFTNDFDLSLPGPHASKNRDAVRSFLAGRLGMDISELGRMLLADFFTDPRRMHLYDLLPGELRAEVSATAEKTAEAIIFAKALSDAEKAGNRGLVDQLRKQMAGLGVKEVPFKPLGVADRSVLYAHQDALHTELEAALKAGDMAAQKRLAIRIGEVQGQIEVAAGGGYFSGGGVRLMVTAREGMPIPAEAAEMLTAQRYTALLDQLPKLYGESNNLLRTGVVATDEAVSAIKGIAKYSKRFNEIMVEMGVPVGDAAATWERLADTFDTILKQAKGETRVTLLDRLHQQADVVGNELKVLMGDFAARSEDVLVQLRQRAELTSNVDLAKVQYLVLAHARYLRAAEALRDTLHHFATGLGRTANTETTNSAGTPKPAPPALAPAPR